MTIKRLSNAKTAAHRRFNDRMTRAVVSGGGALVLLALLVMFFYLLYAVLPLFRAPTIAPVASAPWNRAHGNAPPAADLPVLGIDAALSAAYVIDARGQGQIIPRQGDALPAVSLIAGFSALAAASGGQPLYLLSDSRGGARLARPDFAAGPGNPASWSFPFGESLLPLSTDGRPLRHPALAQPTANQVVMAAQLASGRVLVARLGPDGLTRGELAPDGGGINQVLLSPDGRLLYLLAENQLSIYRLNDDGQIQLRQRQALAPAGPAHITLLPADGSLLVRDAGQRLSLWFDIADDDGHHLARIREFAAQAPPDAQILVSARRPVFGLLAPDGAFSLFSARQADPLLRSRLAAGRAVFSPLGADAGAGRGAGPDGGQDEGILGIDARGWRVWRLDTAFPDISWRTLTQKVWYHHYPAPAWVWQSTSAGGQDSGKFSLVPLLAGTLKAAGYAMLFATPLALAAAMYTAWFMSPALRRWVKPAMEIMGAVPSVIIGLIAGLWLAPYYSRALSGILLLPLLLPAVVLTLGWAISRLPAGLRGRRSPGWECLLLLPALALVIWLVCRLSPLIDGALFGQPMSGWLGDDYNPMNALVIGTAMGFALVPVMFSLAEDALFNVPVRLIQGSLALGATPWQTLLGVILPSASAGLFSAFILGLGRAIGETMIVLMASGNMPRVDGSLFQGLRALAANIAIEIPEAAVNSGHYRILLLTALVLFVFTFLINTLAEALRLRLRAHYRRQEGEAG
ncbi:ABC transporter permease subunit [Acerihabitans arboris]|uniref:ABC transporter permease subunit n=1 Tax=Acerihabitans arboris TaxID=2691583 RepID=A0A845SR98_9GAMM|nr:ABC transporter permease subunit [Acerihabitans arboris]NDL65396.1 ABC transporter permease subunit [Acerihabitans arboris]